MRVGDLVKLKPWCYGAARLGLIIEQPFKDHHRVNAVKVKFLDDGSITAATRNNLEIVSESPRV